ncbi:aldehyde ferredoxin oxidoreductase family protein [Desulfobaculum bizertense]|uniref:Aldehyde:ferredoxin oxidoreductase n=1 Tax=Desulfobaculum bizertense DSM 18034 TaxID=1121442 RepID=A0A1T4WC53_9BACT|nr:aldehyde ferredoxin oxidoreductase C-terminal domain-containing protein [Desulfobaculum bizertense]UIJ37519.1 aldehyde ferredoxin oxidoreductase [Desulfobaculum bizertense]SKA74505.1 aldehyde:ferredoxin oxidoreductase [Desulfobaculum bizertense DSM 18034]
MKILRINTRERTYAYEDMGEYAGLGGRALTSHLVRKEVPANAHPLSKENKLVFAPGLLSGTMAANSGRLSVGAKSPLTGGIKESNSGGMLSQKIAKLGLAAIVLEDKPERDTPFASIRISKDGVEFTDAPDREGKDNYEYQQVLNDFYGSKVSIGLIGTAGEQCLKASTIQFTDPYGNPARSAGRGGLGAVMGSKRVRCIAVDNKGANSVEYADKEAFKDANRRWTKMLKEHPVTGQGLKNFGTAILVNIINEAGALPTKNFRMGQYEHVADVSGERMSELIEQRGGKVAEGCHPGCVMQCSQRYVDKDGNYVTSGFEYETLWGFGPNGLVHDLDLIASMDRLCDEKGIDTIEMANTVTMAMEGGLIEWGDGPASKALLEKVGTDDPMGRIIGNGTGFTAAALGVDRVPTVKNQALPAYDPRAVRGVGVTYATNPMGGDHTTGYAVCQNILKVGGDVNPLKDEGNVELSKNLQIATAAVDASGMCLFTAFAILDNDDAMDIICDLLNARYGGSITPDDVLALGVSTLKDEHGFNADAGFTKHDDQLPRWFKEALPPHNVTWDFTEEQLQEAKKF